MISLDIANRHLKARLGVGISTPGIEYVASYEDVRPEGVSPGSQRGSAVGTDTFTVVSAAASGYPRKVIFLSFRNGASSTARLSLLISDSTGTSTFYLSLLASGDTLLYEHGRGFYVLDNEGRTKGTGSGTTGGGGSSGMEAWGSFNITSGDTGTDLTVSGLTTNAVVVVSQDGSVGNQFDLRYIPTTNNLRIQTEGIPAGAAGIKGSYYIRSLDGT